VDTGACVSGALNCAGHGFANLVGHRFDALVFLNKRKRLLRADAANAVVEISTDEQR
jgi:hypothetical protein